MRLKPLNPKAQEWRPTPSQPNYLPPQLICYSQLPAAPQSQAEQVVAATPTPPHKYLYYWHPCPPCDQSFLLHDTYTQRCHQSFCYVSVSNDQYYHKFETDETNLQLGNVKSDHKKEQMESPTESPKSPRVDVLQKGMRRVIPPRLRRAARCISAYKKPPPQQTPKQVWKLKISKKAAFMNCGEGGASDSQLPNLPVSPPSSADNSSLSSNTTIMIKNIPNKLRRNFMLEFLDDYCKLYSLEYDFLYLPMDFRKKNNLGYAFVNFTTAVAAHKFKRILQNYKWRPVCSDGEQVISQKICDITWARVQGRAALIRRFQNSNFTCNTLEFLPVVLDPPRNGTDPNPPPPVIIGRLDGLSY